MDRRSFLKTGVAGFAGSCACWAVGGLTVSHSRLAMAEPVSISLSVIASLKHVSPTKEVLTWEFAGDSQFQGLGALKASIVVRQGDSVTLNLRNFLPSHSLKIKIPGIDNSSWPTILPGATGIYEFTPTQAGSYVIYDDQNGLLGRAMGLAIPMVVLPADSGNGLYNSAPASHTFQREYTLMLSELDSRINDAVQAGLPFDMVNYQPDYFFVNGVSYPDTVYTDGVIDDNKLVLMFAGEQVAIRFINGGLLYYPMHFHGYHTNVILRDRIRENAVVEKDTVLVKPAETVDTILNVGMQTGLYPLHTHYIPGVTTAGSYAGGALLMLKAE